MTRILFFLGMMTIPFSGVVGLGFLGELQNDLSTYFFIAAIVSGAQFFATSSGAQGQEIPSTKLLAGIMLAVTSVIAVSFFVNAGSILTNVSHGRHAIEKFVSSFVLILYSLMLAYLTFFIAGHGWERAIRKPIAISALLCVAFSVFEILSPLGIATGVYAFLDGIVHGGLTPPGYAKGWDPRLRSLAFEPPDFGNYAGFAWPWLMAGWVSSRRLGISDGAGALFGRPHGACLDGGCRFCACRAALRLFAAEAVQERKKQKPCSYRLFDVPGAGGGSFLRSELAAIRNRRYCWFFRIGSFAPGLH
jgi:hypothetical protein